MKEFFFQEASYIIEKFHEDIASQRFQEEYAGYRVTDGIYLMPALAGRLAPAEFRHVIYLDQYRAFGDGRHPTTRMCLRTLEAYLLSLAPERRDSLRFLDVGTGTGILAIAAAKMGVMNIDAFDVDPTSAESARSNAAINSCPWIRCVAAGVDAFRRTGPYDLVTANLLTDVILGNLEALMSLVDPGARLIASGVSDMRAEEALGALLGRGLTLLHRFNEEGWNCFFLARE